MVKTDSALGTRLDCSRLFSTNQPACLFVPAVTACFKVYCVEGMNLITINLFSPAKKSSFGRG